MRNSNSQMSALDHVNAVSFAAIDIALFLDTHPDNCEALEKYNYYCNLRNQAVAEYSKRFSPLTLSNACGSKKWDWVNTPWPWEGGNC